MKLPFGLPAIPAIPPEARQYVAQVKRTLHRADGLLHTAFQAREGNAMERALAVASVLGQVVDLLVPEVSVREALRTAGFRPVETGLAEFLAGLLQASGAPAEVVQHDPGAEGQLGVQIAYYAVGGAPRAVAVVLDNGEYSSGPYVQGGGEEPLRALLRAHIWGTRSREISAARDGSPQLRELPPPPQGYVGTPSAGWYAARMLAYRTGGHMEHRTIRLIGPSGVGKTTLALTLGHAMLGSEARTLKVSASAAERMTPQDLLDLVDLTGPEVFVVDDWHANDYQLGDTRSGYLAFLEDLHRRVPLSVFTTMDEEPEGADRGRAGARLGLRPGRIDEVFVLDYPDESARAELLRTFNASGVLGEPQILELAKRTVQFTGAYLQELVKRITVHGRDSYRTEVKYMVGELEETHPAEWRRRRRRVLRGRPGIKVIVKGEVNPKARVKDLRTFLLTKKVTLPPRATKADLLLLASTFAKPKVTPPEGT